MKKITIKDIARIAGVSLATVSRALNNLPRISPATKEKILRIASRNGYSPNPLARGLSKGKTNNIGLVLIDITNPFYSPIIQAIERKVEEEGCNLLVTNTEHSLTKEEKYINSLLENRVSGLIISPIQNPQRYLELLKKRKIPAVFLCPPSEVKCDCVDVDNIKGAYDAVNHLIRLGHKRIAYISRGLRHRHPACQRFLGYRNALRDNNLPFSDELVVETITGQGKIEEGYQAAFKLLSNGGNPTAIFTFNDLIAIGCMRALKEKGIRVPEDIAVVGFDDIGFAQFLDVPLTTVKIPEYEMGDIAATLLFERINGERKANNYKRICLIPELVIRKSCGSRFIHDLIPDFASHRKTTESQAIKHR